MKSKWKRASICALSLTVLLTGCALAKGLYADEVPEEDVGIGGAVTLEIVPAEEYHEWVEEKVDSGELKDLSVGENSAYGTFNVEVVDNENIPDDLNWLKNIVWDE